MAGNITDKVQYWQLWQYPWLTHAYTKGGQPTAALDTAITEEICPVLDHSLLPTRGGLQVPIKSGSLNP